MPSPAYHRIRATFAGFGEPLDVPIAVQRQEWEQAAARAALPPGTQIAPVDMGGVAGEWVSRADSGHQSTLIFLHGGGYTSGSCVTHRELAARLCLASGVRVLLVEYRLAPEHPFPAAIEDATASYAWLLAQGGDPTKIAIGGDSAGGGLAAATLLRMRERDMPLPAAAVLLSPWLDLALAGESYQTRAALDPLCTHADLASAASHYLAGADPRSPLASPVYADLRGLPPLLIQVGDHEVLLSDSTQFAERAEVAGVDVTLEVWPELWHVWHAWAGELPEGQRAIDRIGAFVRQRIAYSNVQNG